MECIVNACLMVGLVVNEAYKQMLIWLDNYVPDYFMPIHFTKNIESSNISIH